MRCNHNLKISSSSHFFLEKAHQKILQLRMEMCFRLLNKNEVKLATVVVRQGCEKYGHVQHVVQSKAILGQWQGRCIPNPDTKRRKNPIEGRFREQQLYLDSGSTTVRAQSGWMGGCRMVCALSMRRGSRS